jgi:basic membrane lipoprotein Med (substrate-binding protein (PBP1-ABC) superfamily)
MRPNPLVPAALGAALLASALALPAVGQDGRPDRAPRAFPNASILALVNELDDPAVNEAIIDATDRARMAIRGKAPVRVETLDEVGLLDAAVDAGFEEDDDDEAADLVVLSGAPAADTIEIADEFGDTVYLGVDQGLPCVTPEGLPDPTGTCAGDAESLVRNYASSAFAIEEAGYLAGIVAASASRDGRIGAIGGWPDCLDCNRYIQSFELGVKSVSPSTDVIVAYLTDDDPEVANHDIETGRAFAEAFIDVNELDVILAASGGSSEGVIQAACDAEILAIGTDVDRALAHPRLAGCILTSAMRDYDAAISQEVYEVAEANRDPDALYVGGGTTWDLSNGGVLLASTPEDEPRLPVELPTRLAEATEAILAGQVQVCPDPCGVVAPSDGGAAAEGSPAP